MKKTLTLLAMLPMLFWAACSKNDDPSIVDPITEPTEEELFEVQLSATGLEQTVTPFALKASSPTRNLKSELAPPTASPMGVDFLVYGQNAFIGRYFAQLSDENGNPVEGGGEVSLELPNGKYRVFALAYHAWAGDFYWEDQTLGAYHFSFGFETINNYIIRRFSPLYLCRLFEFEVKNEAVSGNIELTRFNAQLEIEILDDVPEHVHYILFGGDLSSDVLVTSSHGVNTGSPGMTSGYVKMNATEIRNQQEKILRSVFYPKEYSTDKTEKPNTYNILFFDQDEKLVGTKTVENVIFKENHITRLTGNLFETVDDPKRFGAFSIRLIEDFAPDIIKKPL